MADPRRRHRHRLYPQLTEPHLSPWVALHKGMSPPYRVVHGGSASFSCPRAQPFTSTEVSLGWSRTVPFAEKRPNTPILLFFVPGTATMCCRHRCSRRPAAWPQSAALRRRPSLVHSNRIRGVPSDRIPALSPHYVAAEHHTASIAPAEDLPATTPIPCFPPRQDVFLPGPHPQGGNRTRQPPKIDIRPCKNGHALDVCPQPIVRAGDVLASRMWVLPGDPHFHGWIRGRFAAEHSGNPLGNNDEAE